MIVRVTKDLIKIREKDTGRIHNVQLYDNMPLNGGRFIHSEPLIKKGDEDSKGQSSRKNGASERQAVTQSKRMAQLVETLLIKAVAVYRCIGNHTVRFILKA